MVFQVTSTGKVRNDSDFVFFNQPASPAERSRSPAPAQSPSTSPKCRTGSTRCAWR
ncbi:hypothetical protein [Rhodococcus koreensis]